MRTLQSFRKPHYAILLSFLVLTLSCNRYEADSYSEISLLSLNEIELIKKGTLQLIQEYRKNPKKVDFSAKSNDNDNADPLLTEAIDKFVSDDLKSYKENVMNFSNWNLEQSKAIEAIFIVFETLQENHDPNLAYSSSDFSSKDVCCDCGSWWAPLGGAAVCVTVGLLSLGIAGAACSLLLAARVSYVNYQCENQ